MWRFNDDGVQATSISFREWVSLLKRPKPLPDTTVRKCWDRRCGRRAFRDSSYCEQHETLMRMDMYDPERGWSR